MDENIRLALDVAHRITQDIEAGKTSGTVSWPQTSRDLDIRCAQIIGWGHVLDPLGTLTGQPLPDEETQSSWSGIPHYSTDIAAALTLVPAAAERGYPGFELHADFDCMDAYPDVVWAAAFAKTADDFQDSFAEDWSTGPTAAAAIASAFLKIFDGSASSRAGEGNGSTTTGDESP